MAISDWAQGISRAIEDAQDGVGELFEPVIRLGVTGLSRAGKTVFITSLVANLLSRSRMAQLTVERSGRVLQAYLQPQPDDTVPRFDFEAHMRALQADPPAWPASTRAISQLRLSMKLRPESWVVGLAGDRTVHLDIVDYPGEWLLDLPLLTKSYAAWSAEALKAARGPAREALARSWLTDLETVDPSGRLDEPTAQSLAAGFRDYLRAGKDAGLSDLAPGRFLMPGDLEGAPALTFAPLPDTPTARSGSLLRAFERRYEAYKRSVVQPFFRDHFSRLHRQVVLVDLLDALHGGPRAIADLKTALVEILTCFKAGRNGWLAPLLGTKVDRILICATKADHLHHSQHDRLARITEALLAEARSRARYQGAATEAMAIAALRATVEQDVMHDGVPLGLVRGRLLDTGREVALHPGDLPEDPAEVLRDAGAELAAWQDGDYGVMRFAPPRLTATEAEGPPHIRLDRALEFLIGDRL